MLASLAIAVPAARAPFSAVQRFVPALRDTAKAIAGAVAAQPAQRAKPES